MIPLNYLYTIQCLVAFASADIHRRWTNTDIATGNTGGTIIEGCEYWVNDIGLNDSCEAIESYFGITEKQFLSWVRCLIDERCRRDGQPTHLCRTLRCPIHVPWSVVGATV